jgi:predicted membrane-bound spermidine synthase
MEQLPWYKKWLGYLIPLVITKRKTDSNENLKIKYYQGQVQLENGDALYSDGHRYSPFKLSFEFLARKNKLDDVQRFLLLGAGLGSALYRLQKVYHLNPESFLIEKNKDVFALLKEYALFDNNDNVHLILDEAHNYIKRTDESFDLIGVDLFEKLENSSLLNESSFWESLNGISNKKTTLIVNTIFIKKTERSEFEKMLSMDFTFERIDRRPNYFYIAKIK